MQSPMSVGPAQPHEFAAALALVFQHLDSSDQAVKVANGLDMLGTGELVPEGLVVSRDSHGLVAAMIAAPLPGGGAVVWPPQARPSFADPERAADLLVETASALMRRACVKMAQALVMPEHAELAAPLLRHGYRHVTRLSYMRHFLDLSALDLGRADRLTYQAFADCDRAVFGNALERSYAGTLDCPEINGVRTIDEVIAGHQAGGFDPGRWWLAWRGDRPAGVLLVNDEDEWGGWDIAYIGVVPEARRQGIGRTLLIKALLEAKTIETPLVSLAVDARNLPARSLYHQVGFEEFEQREVFLAIWSGGTNDT